MLDNNPNTAKVRLSLRPINMQTAERLLKNNPAKAHKLDVRRKLPEEHRASPKETNAERVRAAIEAAGKVESEPASTYQLRVAHAMLAAAPNLPVAILASGLRKEHQDTLAQSLRYVVYGMRGYRFLRAIATAIEVVEERT